MQKLVAVIQHADSRSGDNEAATDNAVSALGKICLGLNAGERFRNQSNNSQSR
jgi:hypothetical protein